MGPRVVDHPAPGVPPVAGLDRSLASRHLPALDGLRAVAVSLVMLYHYGIPGVPGDLGVTAFFTLSGFLITRLLLAEQRDTADLALRRFWWRRGCRIFPAYYAFLAVSLTIDTLLGDDRSAGAVLPAITYTYNYFNVFHGHPTNSLAHSWSLAVEEQFYLLWPGGFLWLARRGRRWLAGGIAGLLLAAAAWRTVATLVLDAPAAYTYNAFECRADNLLVGCLLAVLLDGSAPSGLSRLAARAWAPVVPIAGFVLVRLPGAGPLQRSLGYTVDAVCMAILMVQLLALRGAGPWRILDWHPVASMGRISYGMYLYHAWGESGARRLGFDGPLRIVAGFAVTTLAAALSFRIIERPFLRLRDWGKGRGDARVPGRPPLPAPPPGGREHHAGRDLA